MFIIGHLISILPFPCVYCKQLYNISLKGGRGGILARYTQMPQVLPGFYVLSWFYFPPGISGIFGWMVGFTEIQQFWDFLEIFPRYFHTICPSFELLSVMNWLNEKRPYCERLVVRCARQMYTHSLRNCEINYCPQTENWMWKRLSVHYRGSVLLYKISAEIRHIPSLN